MSAASVCMAVRNIAELLHPSLGSGAICVLSTPAATSATGQCQVCICVIYHSCNTSNKLVPTLIMYIGNTSMPIFINVSWTLAARPATWRRQFDLCVIYISCNNSKVSMSASCSSVAVPAARKAQTLIMPGIVKNSVDQEEEVFSMGSDRHASSTTLAGSSTDTQTDTASTTRMGKMIDSQPRASGRQHHHLSSSGR